jgi:mannosyl-3-phosphoglycerate phosphatase
MISETINELKNSNVSIVFCTSKTLAETRFYQNLLNLREPVAVENGSAIYIPKKYFHVLYSHDKESFEFDIIELGTPYELVRLELLAASQASNAHIVGFGDMTEKQLSLDSGLPLEIASLAKQREYDEPFRILSGDKEKLFSQIKNHGLSYIEGDRYIHALGFANKGKAVSILKGIYKKQFPSIITMAVGNSPCDMSMLSQVDYSFMVDKTQGKSCIKAAWEDILRLTLHLKTKD